MLALVFFSVLVKHISHFLTFNLDLWCYIALKTIEAHKNTSKWATNGVCALPLLTRHVIGNPHDIKSTFINIFLIKSKKSFLQRSGTQQLRTIPPQRIKWIENNFLYNLRSAWWFGSCLFSTRDFRTIVHLGFLSIPRIQYPFPAGFICLLLLSCFWPKLLTNLWEAWNVTVNGIFNLPLLMHQLLNTKHLSQLSSFSGHWVHLPNSQALCSYYLCVHVSIYLLF